MDLHNSRSALQPIVRTSYDEMEGYVNIPVPGPGIMYTVQEVMEAIEKKGLRYGVDEKAVYDMVRAEDYGHEVLVARGLPKVDGIDGYMKYNFDADLNKKPKMFEDGSVDYWSIHSVELVKEGDVIAEYVPPVEGKNGMSVKGKIIAHKRGRACPVITGKGFERSLDGRTYTATVTGKIELKNERIMISGVHEVVGDVDVQSGNIDFRGDVIIHGNVLTGARIKTTGTITIDGTAEGCYMESGRDILIRGGMKGGDKAMIMARGCISAKFIEYSTVEAYGDIKTDSTMQSTVISYGKIILSGRHGAVVGGAVYACGGIEANNLGNDAYLKTKVFAGVHSKILERIFKLQTQVTDDEAYLERLNIALKKITTDLMANPNNEKGEKHRTLLLRNVIEKKTEIAVGKDELKQLHSIIEKSRKVSVSVSHEIYPNVDIAIDNCTLQNNDEMSSLSFRVDKGQIIHEPLR